MAATPALVLLHYSPWSERARWALEHHGIAYRTIEHVPVIGERRLRKLVGEQRRPATVPVLIDGETVLTDSWAIAGWADRVGSGSPLIPAGQAAEVRRWTELADTSMRSGRALVVAAMLQSPEALDETLPPTVPGWLRPLLRPVNRRGTRWFARKYGLRLGDLAAHAAQMRVGLAALREALAGGTRCLLGSFSYADIAMATLLQGVEPVADAYISLGPATRRAWTQSELARDYADLLRWRDELYRDHRRRVTA